MSDVDDEGEDHTSALDLAAGQAVRGSIAVPGDNDRYIVTARRGQRVFFDVTALGRGCDEDATIYWTLEAPDGTPVFPAPYHSSPLSSAAGCFDEGPQALPAGGRYTLTVYGDGDATGRYAFRLWDAEPDGKPARRAA